MTDRCDDLHAYVDGELDEDEAAGFESHLAICATCTAELPRLLALLAALDNAAAHAQPRTAQLAVLAGGRDAQAPAPETAPDAAAPDAPPPEAHAQEAPAPGTTPLRPVRRRRTWWLVGLPAAAAAAVLLWFVIWPHTPAPPGPSVAAIDAALGSTRPIEARVSVPGADQHRPVDVQRGGSADTASERKDQLLQLEGELERAKDWHDAAVVAMLAGDRAHAARAFDKAPSTPEVDSDRAAFELLDGSPAALERALEDADRALAAAPGSGAARWNRGLALAAMNLPLAAAQEFDRVRALNEPGWADEARTRAGALRAQLAHRRTHWKQASDAGHRLIEDGPPVPADLFDVAGILTVDLYDAVRAAPSHERVLALVPLARALDRVYGRTHLTDYVQRISGSDFAVRRPLADRYRELAVGRSTPEATDALLAQLARSGPGAADIRLGAMVYANRVAAELEDYRRLAAATGDPWFMILAEQTAAAGEIARGDTAAGEHRLRDALDVARRERLAYRAIRLESDLIALHKSALDLSRAAVLARDAYHDAVAAGEWVLEMGLLSDLASIHQNRYAYSLARAYLTELAERAEAGLGTGNTAYASVECLRRLYAYGSLAHLSLLQPEPDPERARAELARAPTCDGAAMTDSLAVTILRNALVRTDLYRLGHRAEDARLARDSLAVLRDLPATVVPGKDAFLAYIEGALTIGDDPAAGRRALREAIGRAGQDAHEFNLKARAHSFSLLALDDGRDAAFDQVTAVMAEALNVGKPERCALAIAADEARYVVAFSDAHGATGGEYVVRPPGALDVARLVPPSVAARLRDCDRVAVLARAPVLGAGRLLPPELAWSYVLTDPAPSAPPAAGTPRLVIANPQTPPDLNLPALGPYPEDPSAGVTVLRGPDATPSRALVAMQDASVIEFHTHGLLADDVFEASHLVLSPELDGRYALTAADVARVRFAASPLVILGACHAATSSRVLEGGMGLPEAFLRAGARAVIASPDAVQDLGADAFFTAVRDRIAQGADPAVALRDERMRQLAASHDDTWVSGVIVFQ